MNIRETLLTLTKETNPYGTEEQLLKYLPKELTKDEFGNYFMKIGNSKTIFACHLDNACKNQVDVVHTFDKQYIKTDGKSILGADDKAGLTVILNLIENKIPALYYFFIGEEVGCIGSGNASTQTDYFNKYDRMICFDRRDTKSIITHQSFERTCSDKFADSLIREYKKQGMVFTKDDGGVYTDCAEFRYIIPECTNMSVGYYNEHTTSEKQDINFLEKLANASIKIDWESLETKRSANAIEMKKWNNYVDAHNHQLDEDRYLQPKRKKTRRGRINKKYYEDDDIYNDNGFTYIKIKSKERHKTDFYGEIKKKYLNPELTKEDARKLVDICVDPLILNDREAFHSIADYIKE